MKLEPVTQASQPTGANQANRALTESDKELARLFSEVSPVVLALAAVHMSGSLDILRCGVRPKPPASFADQSGSLTAEEAAILRGKALEITKAWRDAGQPPPYVPTQDEIQEMINFMYGMDLPRHYRAMVLEDMGFEGTDPRSFRWKKPVSEAAKAAHPVLIIGAGMSGLLVGLRLKEAGLPFVIIEKNDDVGGTWYENQYPGLRVDVPSHAYSFSFLQDHRWTHQFAKQADLHAYFRKCAERFGVRDSIRFSTEVAEAAWDDDKAMWNVTLVKSDGAKETVTARSVVSAVGFLNRPQMPDFPGMDTFEGVSFHSARWPKGLSLEGKRVIIIGNAATGMQTIPQLAKAAKHLTIFQRSAGWSFINPVYHREITQAEQWAIESLPYFAGWTRALVFNWTQDLPPAWMMIDPKFPQSNKSVSAMNEALRARMVADMERLLAGRPDLLAKVIPDYPPFVKRPAVQTGDFYETLLRDNVELVTDRIERVTSKGILDSAGRHHDADIIIYATGFQVQKFLSPLVVKGRGGLDLNEYWGDMPKGYLGIVVPHFPNFYMMYGPGTNLGYNGNIIYNSEIQSHYIAGCIGMAVEEGRKRLEVRESVSDEYMERTRRKRKEYVWSTNYGTTYFRNARGEVTTNSPWSLYEMWTWHQAPDPAHFLPE